MKLLLKMILILEWSDKNLIASVLYQQIASFVVSKMSNFMVKLDVLLGYVFTILIYMKWLLEVILLCFFSFGNMQLIGS